MVRIKALLEQPGLDEALEELPTATIVAYDNVIRKKAYSSLILCLGKSQSEYINEFHKLVGDLAEYFEARRRGRDINSRELHKITEAKGDDGERLYVRGRFGERDMKQDTDSAWSKSLERSNRLSADVIMAMSVEEILDWIMDSGCSYHVTYMRDYFVDFEEYDGVIKNTLKGRKQLGEYQIGWKIKKGNILDSCNQRNMGFNESGEYKKIFISSGVGTGSMQVLQGVEFGVKPQENHTFEVEPHENVDHVVGLQKVQTHDLIYYHSARDMEHLSAWELFSYREDSNKAAFAVAVVYKIYAHESLTFNDTVSCEVIFKWKTGLKEDMDARSDVYVLSNGCKKSTDDRNDYYWEYAPGMFIILSLYIDGMVFFADVMLRSGLPRVCWIKQSEIYLNLLEGSLSGDCDVEKNDKWSCIYVVGSQEYQMVYTRLDIASADVCSLDKLDCGLQTNVQVFVDFDYAMGRSITVMGRSITKYELMIQGCAGRVRIRAKDSSGYCYRCLVKGDPWSEVSAQVKVVAYLH
nr:zinc finger, CCHC-type [Tanacetum cinerariifolium]